MVDSISSHHQGGIDELKTGQLPPHPQIESINRESANAQKSGIADLVFDQADISDEALARLESERELMKYARIANRNEESGESGKAGYFKALFESGRIGDYLNNLSNEELADDILSNPLGAALR